MTTDQLAAYVREVADRIELKDWRFTVGIAVCSDPHRAAEIETIYGRRRATITVSPETIAGDRDELRLTVVHELVHVHTNPIRAQLDNVESVLGKPAFTTIWNATTDVLELATESIACALAPHMPLPPEPGVVE